MGIVYDADKAQKIGYVEAAQGFGTMLGPVIGSFIFAATGYETTMIFFGALLASVALLV